MATVGPKSVAARQATILIVEDNADTRLALTALFSIRGLRPVSVADGAQAMAHLRAAGGDVALVLLDLHMPDVDGRTFLRLKADEPALRDIPVVVYSAVDGTGLPSDVPYVRKGSSTIENLLAVVEGALRIPNATL